MSDYPTHGSSGWDVTLKAYVDEADAAAATDAETAATAAIATAKAAAIQRANHTGTQSADTVTDGTTNKAYTATEKTKLSGVATGATVNDTNANLLNRANHTGTQSADTLTDGSTNKTYTGTEKTKLAGITAGATPNSSDATLLARANHTGSQPSSTISDFTEASQDLAATMLTAGTHTGGLSFVYDDATGVINGDASGGVTSVNGQVGDATIDSTDIADFNTAVDTYNSSQNFARVVQYPTGGTPPSGYPDNTLYVAVSSLAITFTDLLHSQNGTDQSAYTFPSSGTVSPTVGRNWFLLVVSGRTDGNTTPAGYPTTMTGLGLTWTARSSATSTGSAAGFMAARVYQGSGTPTAGTLTANFGAVQHNCSVFLIEVANSTSTIVEIATPYNGSASVGNPASPTFAGIAAGNAVLSFFITNSTSQAGTIGGSDHALDSGVDATSPTIHTQAAYATDGTTVDWTSAGSAAKLAFGFELAPS